MKYNYLLLGLIILFSSCKVKVEKNSKPLMSKSVVLPAEGNYNLNTSKSTLTWTGKEITTKTHTGTIDIKSGNIKINSNKSVTGAVLLVMNTLKVTDLEGKSKEYLEGHLKSKDFFGVKDFPEAKLSFKSKNISEENNSIYFDGELTIKSTTEKVSFEATLKKGEPTLEAIASLTFDRTKFNVIYRSGGFFDDLGDKLILDDIEVQMNINAEKL